MLVKDIYPLISDSKLIAIISSNEDSYKVIFRGTKCVAYQFGEYDELEVTNLGCGVENNRVIMILGVKGEVQ